MRERGLKQCNQLDLRNGKEGVQGGAFLASGLLPGGSEGKNPPAMQEIQAGSRGGEDPLGEEMATHWNILA